LQRAVGDLEEANEGLVRHGINDNERNTTSVGITINALWR